jgi:hypothetical protein
VYDWLAASPEVRTVTGGYFDEKRQPVRPSAWAMAPVNIEQVMRLTARYIPRLMVNSAMD